MGLFQNRGNDRDPLGTRFAQRRAALQKKLLEAIPYSLDDGVLLFGGHLVVAGQAEPAGKDVGAHIGDSACDVGVGAGAAVTLRGHEGVAHVHGLHVHGFPNGAALGVHGGDAFQDFRGAALARLVNIQGVGFAADLLAHGVFVDNHAAEPEVRFAVGGVVGVHLHREALQAFLVAHVDSLFLGDVLFQVRHLAADHAGDDVAHAVVVAHLFVLVPGGCLAALGAPLAHLLGVVLAVGQEHAAATASDNLVAVKTDGAVVAELAGLYALVASTEAFGGVFDEERVVFFADGADFVHLARRSVQMNEHHQSHVGVNLEGLLERDRIHVPGVVLGVDEHGLAVLVSNGVHRRVESHVAAEHLVPAQAPLAHLGHAVKGLARKLCAKVQCGGTGGECHGVLAADLFGSQAFDLVDVRTHGAHPVGLVCFGHILDFFAVHGGATEPDFLFETRHDKFSLLSFRGEI